MVAGGAGFTPGNAPFEHDRFADVRQTEKPRLVTCRVCLGKMGGRRINGDKQREEGNEKREGG